MHKTFLVLLTLACSVRLYAQGTSPAHQVSIDKPPLHRAHTGIPSRTEIMRRIRAMQAAIDERSAGLKATGTGMRLTAVSGYDFSTQSLSDSAAVRYKATRTSKFDFDELSYNIYYNYPSLGAPEVMYDTIRTFNPPGSAISTVTAVRTYNASGNALREDGIDPGYIFRLDITYNTQGLPSKDMGLLYDAATMTWDSTQRTFYTYNAQGKLSRDSVESWDGTSWVPAFTRAYVTNPAGYPIKTTGYFDMGSGQIPVFEYVLTYNTANKPTLVIGKGLGSSQTLENEFKDSLGYTGTMKTSDKRYEWDPMTSTWTLIYEERRYLNAANLPDSVRGIDYTITPAEIQITKLAYNAAGLPVYQRYFDTGVPEFEARYYYGTYDLGVNDAKPNKSLSLYPNPASGKILVRTFDGAAGAVQYAILNAAGQIVQSTQISSTYTSEVMLSITGLAPGNYFIIARDEKGQGASAQFVKQ